MLPCLAGLDLDFGVDRPAVQGLVLMLGASVNMDPRGVRRASGVTGIPIRANAQPSQPVMASISIFLPYDAVHLTSRFCPPKYPSISATIITVFSTLLLFDFHQYYH